MVFSSLFFLYLFFPLCMLFYFFANTIQEKNTVFLVFSLLFYTWGEPKYVFLLIFMAFADWLLALCIQRAKHTKKAKLLLILACTINLGLIAIFKYTGFFLSNLSALTGFPSVIPQIMLPIGISFYTFQLLSYVADVYRGDVEAQPKFHIVLLYASLFHQCIAGPIVRYKDVERELLHRTTNIIEIAKGITRFCVGLAKKAVLANTCGQLADTLLVADSGSTADMITTLSSRSVVSLWLGVLVYALQIYLDFSAYSDMAIGMGWMVGLHYKENFDYPYLSGSVSEFWRRWHISLGGFFRDYVYIPLGGSRKGELKTYRNLLIVWFLTGLWHGASWNFILWGLYFFVFLVLERKWIGNFLKHHAILRHIYLLIVVYFGWILFKFSSMSAVGTTLFGMFGLNGNAFTDFATTTVLKSNLFFLIMAVIAATPFAKKSIQALFKRADNYAGTSAVATVLRVSWPIVLLLLATITLVGNSYNPFLYFQF